jgi:uncharacterized protein (DUF2225 family)
MTTLHKIELTCPICQQVFSSQAVLSTNLLGKRTDFHETTVGPQPLPYFVHTCSRCGYSGGQQDFDDDAAVNPVVKEHVWDELAPKLPSHPLTGSDKYEFAAKVAIWQGAPPRRVADLFLRAAWCCVDEGDVEAERYFRRFAAWGFEDALSSQDVTREERPVLTYLVGELWRRIGDVEHARVWFDRVLTEITNAKEQKWIVVAARQQRELPREWFWSFDPGRDARAA